MDMRIFTLSTKEKEDERGLKTIMKSSIQLLILMLPIFFLFLKGYSLRWNSEDAFITFRVCKNLISGHGPVYNIDERVEVYTHPLWLGVLCLSTILTKTIESNAVWLSLLFSCLGLLFGILGGIRLFRKNEDAKNFYIPLGAYIIASIPPFWDFATSGLEMGLAFFWIGISFFMLSLVQENKDKIYIALLWFSLGPLIRPDFGIFWLGFSILSLIIFSNFLKEKISLRKSLIFIFLSFLCPLSYQIFRMGYFAALFPNPAFAKEAFAFNAKQGFSYLSDTFLSYFLFLPFVSSAGTIFTLKNKNILISIVFFILGLFHIFYIVIIGGDFMHGRLLLPGLFSIFIAFPFLTFKKLLYAFLIGSNLTWCIVCIFYLRVPYKGIGEKGIANEREFYVTCAKIKNPISIEDYKNCNFYKLGIEAKKSHFFSTKNIGITGFVAGESVHIFDRLGLADPIASRLELTKRGRPGHEKDMPMEWVMARLEGNFTNPKIYYAKKAMECGELREYIEGIRGRLNLKKFIKNIFVAVKTAKMRIPAEPYEAMYKFCFPPEYTCGTTITYRSLEPYFSKGFAAPEEHFRWTEGVTSVIYLSIKKKHLCKGILKLNAGTLEPREVRLTINDRYIGNQILTSWGTIGFNFDPRILFEGRANTIKLEVPQARRPDNGDIRILGIAFVGLVIE